MKAIEEAARRGRLVFLLSLSASAAWSADTTGIDTTGIFRLGDITVTGHRKGMDKIRPDAPEKAEPRRDAARELARIPGVVLTGTGKRNETQVFVRGFDARQVALYVDGVPVYVPYDGNVDMTRFSSAELASISVEKGASSLAYGPNAMGGAINLVTAQPHSPLELDASAGLISWAGQNGSLRVGARKGDFYALGAASFRRANNWDLPSDWTAVPTEDGGRRENSHSFDRTWNVKLGWDPGEGNAAAISYVDQHGIKGDPPYTGTSGSASYWKWPYWDHQSVNAVGEIKLGSHSWLKVPVYVDRFKNSLFMYDNASYSTMKKSSSGKSWYDDWTSGGSLQYGLADSRQDTLRVFAHFKNDLHTEDGTSNDTAKSASVQAFVDKPHLNDEDRTYSLGTEGVIVLPGNLTLSPGASGSYRDEIDANYIYSAKSTPTLYQKTAYDLTDMGGWDAQAVLRWTPSKANEFKLSLSDRCRLPTLKERYSWSMGKSIPNAALDPERALQVEIGYAGRPADWILLQASLWEAWLDNAIQSVTVQTGITQNQNSGSARFSGPEWFSAMGSSWAMPAPELSVQVSSPWKAVGLDHATVSGSYAYTLRRNTDTPSLLYINMPRHTLHGNLMWGPVSWGDLVWNSTLESSRLSSSDGTTHAGAYAVSDVVARVRVREFTFEAGMQNLFDRNYCLAEGYPEEGRTGFVNIKYSLR